MPPTPSPLKAMRRLWKRYIRDCRRRNVYWGIGVELFHKLTSQSCAYCGKPPAQKDRAYLYNGLDRKNPKKGYEPTNVVPCCGECNGVKSNRLTYEEMLAVAQALNACRRKAAA